MSKKTIVVIFAVLAICLLSLAYTGSDLEKAITYVRLYPDAEGESHFEDVAISLAVEEVQPPAVPFYISSFNKATSFGYYSFSAGDFDNWHNAPRRQFLFCLAGEFEIQASDGEVRLLGQGAILLVEDTTGKGHRGHAISSEDVLLVVVTLE